MASYSFNNGSPLLCFKNGRTKKPRYSIIEYRGVLFSTRVEYWAQYSTLLEYRGKMGTLLYSSTEKKSDFSTLLEYSCFRYSAKHCLWGYNAYSMYNCNMRNLFKGIYINYQNDNSFAFVLLRVLLFL